MGCIFYTENQKISEQKSLLGDIMKYHVWGYNFEKYESSLKKGTIPKYIVKVWTGR